MKIHVLGHGGTAFALLPPGLRPGKVEVDSIGLQIVPYGSLFLGKTLKEAIPGHSVDLFTKTAKPLEAPTWAAHLQAYEVSGKTGPVASSVRIRKKLPIELGEDARAKIAVGKLECFWPSSVQNADLNLVFVTANLACNQMPAQHLSRSPLLLCLSASSMIKDERERAVAAKIEGYRRSANEETAIVLGARTLNMLGVPMPNCVSPERFAQECSKIFDPRSRRKSRIVGAIIKFKHVIVRFGPLAAYLQSQGSRDIVEPRRELFYVVNFEGVPASCSGYLSGFSSLLVIALAKAFTRLGSTLFDNSWVEDGLSEGLVRCASLEEYGYSRPVSRKSVETQFNRNWATELFEVAKLGADEEPKRREYVVYHLPVPWPFSERNERWSILGRVIEESTGWVSEERPGTMIANAVKIGGFIVTEGLEAARNAFKFAFSRFGDLKIVDRREFEDYVEVQSLLTRYMSNPSESGPLSLAVFGPPGNGKSYGITELARVANPDAGKQILEVNCAQLGNVANLVTALHQARDLGIGKKLPPLVLFDEFDASLNGRQFGWLEYFLMPMQDGKFRDASSTYNIGRAIFVFIGGVNHSFDMLYSRMRNREFIEAKGPDFVSRLRGHLDVLGISALADDRPCVIVRRAVLLRTFLEKHHPALKSNHGLKIDEKVVKAFLLVEEFRHGVRSMEALVRMCRVDPRENWLHLGSLPAEDQMNMHVDCHDFLKCVEQ